MPRYRNVGARNTTLRSTGAPRRRFKIPVPIPRRILGGIGRTLGFALSALLFGPIIVGQYRNGHNAGYPPPRANSPHPSTDSDDD